MHLLMQKKNNHEKSRSFRTLIDLCVQKPLKKINIKYSFIDMVQISSITELQIPQS